MIYNYPFIVIEGTDGSGKSTLCDWITSVVADCLVLRNRQLLVDTKPLTLIKFDLYHPWSGFGEYYMPLLKSH